MARTVLARLSGQEALREKAPDGAIASVFKRVLGTGGDQKIKVRGVDDLMVFLRALLQSDPRRAHRRLHHARQGRVGPLGDLPQRRQPAVRPRAPDRRRVGQGRRRIAVHGPAADQRRGPARHPRGRELTHRRRSTPTSATSKRRLAPTQRGSIRMTVEISDVKHLEKVMKSIKNIEGVLAVERAGR